MDPEVIDLTEAADDLEEAPPEVIDLTEAPDGAADDLDLDLEIVDNSPQGKIIFTSSSSEDEDEAPLATRRNLSGDESDISLDESDQDFVDDSDQPPVDHAAVASATAEIEARTAEEEARAATERRQSIVGNPNRKIGLPALIARQKKARRLKKKRPPPRDDIGIPPRVFLY